MRTLETVIGIWCLYFIVRGAVALYKLLTRTYSQATVVAVFDAPSWKEPYDRVVDTVEYKEWADRFAKAHILPELAKSYTDDIIYGHLVYAVRELPPGNDTFILWETGNNKIAQGKRVDLEFRGEGKFPTLASFHRTKVWAYIWLPIGVLGALAYNAWWYSRDHLLP